MRSLGVVLFLGALVACQPRQAQHEPERVGPCLGFAQTLVRHRTEASFVVVEAEIQHQVSCPSPTATNVTVLAKIELPGTRTACPIGEAALRSGSGFDDKLLPSFLATLSRENLAEATDSLRTFADAARGGVAEAFVVSCNTGSADWLFVQTVPRGERGPEVALFVNGELRRHDGTTALLVASASTPSAPPSAQGRGAPGDCTEPLEQADTRWVGRDLVTGVMPGPSRLETYRFGRTRDRATVVIQATLSSKPNPATSADLPSGEWRCEQSTTLTGTVVERGAQLVFWLSEAGKPSDFHEVICTPRTVSLARADAVRVPVPSTDEGCNAHRWAPAPSAKRNILSCISHDPSWSHLGHEVFVSDVPGIEHVTLDNDDCGDRAMALRIIPGDSAVAPARRARPVK